MTNRTWRELLIIGALSVFIGVLQTLQNWANAQLNKYLYPPEGE